MAKDVQSRQDSQEASVMQISDMAKTISGQYSLEALNGSNGPDERSVYATSIREFQKSMVLSLNATYEDEFIFAGTGGQEVPFELSADGKTLTYRGIDVNDSAAIEKAGYNNEKLFVDLGFGLSTDAGNVVIPSSAFNTALPGIDVVGYGKDADGSSKNLIVLAGEMANVLTTEPFDSTKIATMSKKFSAGVDSLMNTAAVLGTKTQFLDTTLTRLEDSKLALNKQIKGVERVDLTEAITNYSWSQYSYDAALRVGNSILSPSFIDFMK
ncbi:MAG: hypothetical protein RR681_03645, partial [Lachnospiraceae bacterium]